MTDELIIGMIPPTDGDGVDTVLVNFSNGSIDLLHATYTPYPAAIRQTLGQLFESGEPPTRKVAELLDENLAFFFARAVQNLVRETGLEMRDIRAIGSGGHNVWHQPCTESPATIQLGKGDLIARNTGTTVVNNFRNADVKAGGRGAPLAPLLHRSLFHCDTENRAVVNLGSIANLTILPSAGVVTCLDCGPGSCLMDGWSRRQLQKDHDDKGRWAAKGELDTGLLSLMLADPFFRQASPKRTGTGHFSMSWLDKILGQTATAAVNIQTTLAELSAQSIADSLAVTGLPERLLVCGGGIHNAFLMQRIAAALPGIAVDSTASHGTDPDWVEGLLFAWLARKRLQGQAQDTTAITGSGHPVLLGEIHEPRTEIGALLDSDHHTATD